MLKIEGSRFFVRLQCSIDNSKVSFGDRGNESTGCWCAGYVGSHTVRLLNALNHDVWVYDNLSRGHVESVPREQFIQGNLTDRSLLMQVMLDKEIEAVMHFAAFALVGESVQHPAMYYQNNVTATFELLEAMRSVGVWRFVFSSTTATYGQPEKMPIREDTPQDPINPYGFTKLVVERALRDYAAAYGFGVAALRYFNASGASADGSIGEDHDPESHLIPIVLQVCSDNVMPFKFSAMITPPRMELVFGTTSMWRIWQRHTWQH